MLWQSGIVYDHVVYFKALGCLTAIWCILRPCGILFRYLVYFSGFGTYVVPRKIWQRCCMVAAIQYRIIGFAFSFWGEGMFLMELGKLLFV
jgi:hypothetical protein